MSNPIEQDKERILFYLLLECLCRQIDMLEGKEKHQAKMWLNTLISTARKTVVEMRKNMDITTQELFEDMYDYVYMTVRDAANVDASDVDEFRSLVSNYILDKYSSSKTSMFAIADPQ